MIFCNNMFFCRTKKTTETIYKRVDDVWSEAEETSKKVSQG
jgi:mitochondrial import inner membrane translocase subunit TIM44